MKWDEELPSRTKVERWAEGDTRSTPCKNTQADPEDGGDEPSRCSYLAVEFALKELL